MADIFSKATWVVVWLGPETSETFIAMDFLELLASKIEVDWDISEIRSISNEAHWADQHTCLPLDKTQFLALNSFFGHPWFERLWIWLL